MAAPTVTLEERFWSKVLKTETCWLWQRDINNRGYGCFCFPNPNYPDPSRRSRPTYAHRAAWMLTHGQIPDGLNVLHHCDTPRCVNPDHLFLGTHADNMADARQKKRFPRQYRRSRLTPDDVRSIRVDPRKHHIIAADYGLKRLAVLLIKHRKTWADIP